MDFKDINKSYPKNDVPLPNIDLIVNLTTGHAILSLMDGFFVYNQIIIAPKYQYKTAFTYPWGTFYWNIMPFGLKNASATYQRVMTLFFYDIMYVLMEDYMDDLLGKSITREDHLSILTKIFDWLKKYKVGLNLKKCVFRLTNNIVKYEVLIIGLRVAVKWKIQDVHIFGDS